jgi:hypothetical protein
MAPKVINEPCSIFYRKFLFGLLRNINCYMRLLISCKLPELAKTNGFILGEMIVLVPPSFTI